MVALRRDRRDAFNANFPRYGMPNVVPQRGFGDVFPYWGFQKATADDLDGLMNYVLTGLAPPTPPPWWPRCSASTPDQQWGVWGAGAAMAPGNKNGWSQEQGGWVVNSVGFAGPGQRYTLAVMNALGDEGGYDDGVTTTTQLSRILLAPVGRALRCEGSPNRCTNSRDLIRNSTCRATSCSGSAVRVERHSTTAPSSAAMQVTANDPASASSKPSATNARVSAARHRSKMSPAMDVSAGSASAEPIAAATTGQPAAKSLSASVRSQNATNWRISGVQPWRGGVVDESGDRVRPRTAALRSAADCDRRESGGRPTRGVRRCAPAPRRS